jgi:recombination protein RecT
MSRTKESEQQSSESTAIEQVHSRRFLAEVERQFVAQIGGALEFSEHEKRLGQHLYVKVDAALKAMEENRLKRNQTQKAEFAWKNVNIQKLAIDSVHRIRLGLDALIPNHIHSVAYWNSKAEKYDIDLRIGYVGQDYARRRLAIDSPIDVIYELVYETDHFKPLPRSTTREVEGYEFEIQKPFARGEVIGGFGYIIYDDSRKNRLVLVTPRDFQRSRNSAQTKDFWDNNDLEMKLKTVVHRVTAKIPLDPNKVNAAAFALVDAQEHAGDIEQEVAQQANRQTIDVEASAPRPGNGQLKVDPEPELEVEPEPAPEPEVQVEGQSRLGPDF